VQASRSAFPAIPHRITASSPQPGSAVPNIKHFAWDVEELDRVIDAAENGSLSKADCQKLKTTLDALVERLTLKRNTEKTSSVLKPKA